MECELRNAYRGVKSGSGNFYYDVITAAARKIGLLLRDFREHHVVHRY